MFGFDAIQILHLEQGATEVHRDTFLYIETKNLTATFTVTKMFLTKYILYQVLLQNLPPRQVNQFTENDP